MRRYYSRLRRQSSNFSNLEPIISKIVENYELNVEDYISDGIDIFTIANRDQLEDDITENVENWENDILDVIDKIVIEKLLQKNPR